jgi:hypothetical protein
MDSSVSAKDEIWFLRVCRHISNAAYHNRTAQRWGPLQRQCSGASLTISEPSFTTTPPQLISLRRRAVRSFILFKRIFQFLSAMFLNIYSAHFTLSNANIEPIPSSSELKE